MKNIIKYLGALLAVVLMGTMFTACSEDDGNGSADLGLGIKVFFPTKVVTNQPITINGSGFNNVTEIEFPGGVKATNFEIVSNDMIRVDAPSGIAADGGKIVVRTADDEAESPLPLTIGHTIVSGYSKQAGESAVGGELITVYGTDLEFINSIELLDANGNPQLIDHKDFYRKGTSNLIFRVPLTDIYTGKFEGILHTFDGQSFTMPELAYEPSKDGGHMEIIKTTIWKNDGSLGEINWTSDYRFAPESNSTGEECYTVPQDVWEKMKNEKFFMKFKLSGDSYQIRVTTGWWGAQWLGKENDIAPWNMPERVIDNGDGTHYIEIEFGDDPIVADLDAQHLLFTGAGYTPMEIYTEEEVWVDGGEDQEVQVFIWKNDGSLGEINWTSDYRFAPESNSTGEECYTVPQDVWEKMKNEKFFMKFKLSGDSYQIRVTTGWWGAQWLGKENDIAPWNMPERVIDNGDGTHYIEIEFGDDPIVADLDAQHLLFTGAGYTPLEIYFIDIIKGGGSSAKETVFWENSTNDKISWSNTYRFALEGHDGANECIAEFPQDVWDKIKTGTFYLQYRPEGDSYQVRITNGWWDTQWLGKDNDIAPWNMPERIIDNGDGTCTIEINFGDDPIVETLDEKHLLITGDGYTPLKFYYK